MNEKRRIKLETSGAGDDLQFSAEIKKRNCAATGVIKRQRMEGNV